MLRLLNLRGRRGAMPLRKNEAAYKCIGLRGEHQPLHLSLPIAPFFSYRHMFQQSTYLSTFIFLPPSLFVYLAGASRGWWPLPDGIFLLLLHADTCGVVLAPIVVSATINTLLLSSIVACYCLCARRFRFRC